jgi:hypothetical protein
MTHDSVAFATSGQIVLHPPQWVTLVCKSTHCVPQRVGAWAVQPVAQTNPAPCGAHSGVLAGHTALHAPQWEGTERSVSHPSSAFWLQSANPGLHVLTAHFSPAHVVVARESAQGVQLLLAQP